MDKIENGYRFREPAPRTIELFKETDKKFNNMETTMSELNTNFLLMKKDITSISEKLDQNTQEHKDIMSKIDRFIETADQRYAEKRVEDLIGKILWAFGFLVVGAISAAVFKLIFK